MLTVSTADLAGDFDHYLDMATREPLLIILGVVAEDDEKRFTGSTVSRAVTAAFATLRISVKKPTKPDAACPSCTGKA